MNLFSCIQFPNKEGLFFSTKQERKIDPPKTKLVQIYNEILHYKHYVALLNSLQLISIQNHPVRQQE